MLTPDDLLLVLAVSEEGSLTAAADRLGTSQPALSRALNALERRIGARLFERRARGMSPTPAGQLLLAHGRAVAALNERAERQLVAHQSANVTQVVVGIVPQISIVPVARALGAMREFAERAHVEAVVGDPASLLRALREGRMDIVIGPLPEDGRDLLATPLFDDHPVLAVRSGHPAVRTRKALDLARLLAFPWIMPPPASPASARVRALFEAAALDPPHPEIVTTDVPLTTAVVGTSDFITVLPHDVAMIAVGMLRLAVLPVELPGAPSAVGALRRRDMPAAAAATYFIDALVKELGRIGVGRGAR